MLKEHRAAHSAWSKVNEIHAELNAILFAARNGSSIDGATMYVTLSPCPDCAKAIAQSGIKKLVELKFRNRPSIKCTPQHIFLTTDQEELEAQNLKGKRIAPYLNQSTNLNKEFIKYGFYFETFNYSYYACLQLREVYS